MDACEIGGMSEVMSRPISVNMRESDGVDMIQLFAIDKLRACKSMCILCIRNCISFAFPI